MSCSTTFATVSFLIATAVSGFGNAEEFRVSPGESLKDAVSSVTHGDSIVLTNGQWPNADLKFEQLQGTSDEPIRIRAETPGKVIFSGSSLFRVSGQHVIVSGLVFRNCRDISDVVQLRTHSKRHAHHCRLTDCVFECSGEASPKAESRWLSIYGSLNRIDHCSFSGKKNKGATVIVWVSDSAQHHQIDHNYFGPRPELGRNGGETIRIGTSDTSEFESATRVEDNYFFACDGEAETISNKSCANIFRRNLFDECSGTLTLRHGHRYIVDGNVFLGRKKRGTGGVRIIGRDHRVTNNYFEGLRGDAERAALCMMNGIPNSPLSGYAPVKNAMVAHNTFVDCKVSLEVGVGAGSKQSADPIDCRIQNNAFLPGKWQLARVHSSTTTFLLDGNRQQQEKPRKDSPLKFERTDLHLERGSDGLLRPSSLTDARVARLPPVSRDIDNDERPTQTIAGCDERNDSRLTLPSRANTGPSWQQAARP